ncbi:MAG: hypothetical protein ACJA2W_000573 [Planctomycetota bacterium]|jgi:hypothetical protein
MSQSYRPLWLSPLVLIAFLVAGSGLVVGLGMTWASGTETGATGSDYIAEHVDSICGLDDVRVLSKPASVQYDDLMNATAERRRMQAESIDPTSALGQVLETKARRRVHTACHAVMTRLEHCSVWKEITHRNGAEIADITPNVVAALDSADSGPETVAASR